MNLWFRLVYVFIVAQFRARLGFFDHSVMQMRVWPTDLDVNVHMNNARYLSVMDLGRFDLFLRTGMWRTFWRRRWQPLLGATMIRYKRALRPFESFTMHSRFVGWDERRAYMEHWIEVDGVVACQAVMWAGFRGAGQRVSPVEIARDMGVTGSSPALPDWVQSWRELDITVGELKPDDVQKAAE